MTVGPVGEVISISVVQPRFTKQEKALLLASRRAANARRGRHGRLLSEALDSENQFAYVVRGPVTDWAQKKLNEAEETYRKAHPNADMDALQFWVEKRD